MVMVWLLSQHNVAYSDAGAPDRDEGQDQSQNSFEHIPLRTPEPPENQGLFSLRLQVILGIANLSSTGETTRSEIATLRGLGARLTYGLSKHISMEGDFSVLDTNNAEFDDGALDEVTMGRLQLAGTLHKGEQFVPYGRVALGSYFGTDTITTADETETNYLLGMVFTLGAGLDVRLGDHFIVGISGAFSGGSGSGVGIATVEGAAQFGYSWK